MLRSELLASEKCHKIAIEFIQILMNVDHITGVHAGSGWRSVDGGDNVCFVSQCTDGFFRQATKSQMRFVGITIVHNRCNKVAGVTVSALDKHRPHVRSARDHVDVVRMKLTMTYRAAVESIEDYFLDLNF